MRTAIALLVAAAVAGLAVPAPAGARPLGHSERLATRARRGDRVARTTLVEEHMSLVRAVALRYRGLGVPVEDLVQEGAIGLLSAVDKYDASRGATFSTYAFWRIRAAVTHALTTTGNVVRFPRSLQDRRQRAVPVSLDRPLVDGAVLGDRLEDDPSSRPDARALRKLEAMDVRAALRRLRPRKRAIVSRHFGIDREPETLSTIAADLHLSPARTRALEDQALRELATTLACFR